MFTKRNKTRILLGFFIVNHENKEVISITRYPYAEHLADYIEAATTENQDIKRIWRKSFEIKTPPDLSESDKEKINAYLRERADSPGSRLIKEATEYYVLEMLSMHLTDYFADHQFREENLEKFDRKHIPAILMENRFLELFSRPMDERVAFDKFRTPKGIIYSRSEEGALYHRFQLTLPRGSIITRENDGTIKIETRELALKITIDYSGLGTVIPGDFLEFYLNMKNYKKRIETTDERRISIILHVSFKFPFFLSGAGIRYYNWIDIFLDILEESFSGEFFFNKIQWESASTVLRCLNLNGKSFKETPSGDTSD